MNLLLIVIVLILLLGGGGGWYAGLHPGLYGGGSLGLVLLIILIAPAFR